MAVRKNLTANRGTPTLQYTEGIALDTALDDNFASIILANLGVQKQIVRTIPWNQLQERNTKVILGSNPISNTCM